MAKCSASSTGATPTSSRTRLQQLRQPARSHRIRIRRTPWSAATVRSCATEDGRDGNGQRVHRRARAKERLGSHGSRCRCSATTRKSPTLSSTAATPRRPAASRPDRQLEPRQRVLHLALRQPPLRTAQLDGVLRRGTKRSTSSSRRLRASGQSPLYSPKDWDDVIYHDMWTNRDDPIMTCQPMGIRQGAPGRISRPWTTSTLLYGRGGDGGGGNNGLRVLHRRPRVRREGARANRYGYFHRPLGRRHARDRVEGSCPKPGSRAAGSSTRKT